MVADLQLSSIQPLPAIAVQSLLREYQLRPNSKLGQNFLVDDSALRKIVVAAGITDHARVLEIGAGLGSLTRYLAELSESVCAVELDERFLPILKMILSKYKNVNIIHGDILELDPIELMGNRPYQVVANIPYYITSAVIRHLLDADIQPYQLVLTVQREVAERIIAKPGQMSLLAISVQVYGQPEIIDRIPAGAFYPVPNVDSSVVRIQIAEQSKVPRNQLSMFFQLAKAGFSQKRKMLRNSLAAGLGWKSTYASELLMQADIDPKRRAETLSIEEWSNLTEVVYVSGNH